MGYSVCGKVWKNMFAIPAEIVDKGLKLCPESALKALLVIFRNGGEVDAEEISRKLNVNAETAQEAIEYLVSAGLLFDDEKPESLCEKGAPDGKRVPLKVLNAPLKKPTAKEIDELGSKKEVRALLHEAETILGKTFTSSDTSTLIWLYEWAGVPADVLLTVVAYCKKIGKTGMNYIQSTAVGWINDGIDTTEKAEEYLTGKFGKDEFEKRIRRLFGLWGRSLTENEKRKLEIWSGYGFSDEMYKEAYDRTVEATGKVSFNYMNTILASWNEKSIFTLEDAEKDKEKERTDGNAGKSYDIDELEEKLLGIGK